MPFTFLPFGAGVFLDISQMAKNKWLKTTQKVKNLNVSMITNISIIFINIILQRDPSNK